jgi:hypothetical protein
VLADADAALQPAWLWRTELRFRYRIELLDQLLDDGTLARMHHSRHGILSEALANIFDRRSLSVRAGAAEEVAG